MPQKKTSLAEKTVHVLAQKTAVSLVQEAESQISQLLTQKNHIGQMKSDLDILMKRYFVEQSFFDHASQWYGQKSWLQKSLIMVSFIGLSALVGAIFNLAALLSVVAIGLYSAADFLLTQHQRISSERSDRLCSDIDAMEKDLKKEVEQLSSLEVCLQQIFVDLNQERLHLAKDNAEFEKTVSRLNAQIKTLNTNFEELKKSKDGLLSSHEKLEGQVKTIGVELDESQKTLQQKTSEISAMTEELTLLKSKLDDSAKDLTSIHEEYQKRLTTLAELEALFNEQLSLLTTTKGGEPDSDEQAAVEMDEFDLLLADAEESLRSSALKRVDTDRLIVQVGQRIEERKRLLEGAITPAPQ